MPSSGTVHMGCDSSNVLYYSRFYPCFELEIVGLRVPLVPHLRHQLWVFQGPLYPELCLVKGSRHRFFYVHMFSRLHTRLCNRKMGTIRSGDGHSIKITTR